MRVRHIFVVLLLLLPTSAFALGSDSMRGKFVVSGTLAYFPASSHDDALELWTTDGTPGGTRRAADLGGGSVVEMVAMDEGVAFFVSTASGLSVWRGDRKGAVRIAELGAAFLDMAAVRDGQLMFSLSYWRAAPVRHELWASDGTAERTSMLAPLPYRVETAIAAGGLLYFVVPYAPAEPQLTLWRSDGTAAGTMSLHRTTPTEVLGRVGGAALYNGQDGLWRTTDGTLETTDLLARVTVSQIVTAGAFAYAIAPHAVWRTDGTLAGTAPLLPPAQWDGVQRLVVAGQDLYFATGEAYFFHDTESGQATRVGFGTEAAAVAGGRFFFGSTESGLFVSEDPYRPAIRVAESIAPSTGVVPLGNRVLFSPSRDAQGIEPWVSDGTPQGTVMLANIRPETTLRGSVFEAGTGQPLPGAVVRLEGRAGFNVQTDADGHFVFAGLPDDDYFVSAFVVTSDYVKQAWPTRIRTTGADVNGIDFLLQRGGGISGRVVDVNGAPVANIIVEITTDRALNPGAVSSFFQAYTRADGTYATQRNLQPDLPWSVRTLGVSATSTPTGGYSGVLYDAVPCWKSCDPRRDGTPVVPKASQMQGGIDFVVKPLGTARGHLVDAMTGEPVLAGVRMIGAQGTSGSTRDFSFGTIEAAGEYSARVADGGTTITVYFNNPSVYQTSSLTGVLAAPGTTSVYDIPLTPIGARVRGRVTDAQTGRPVAGVHVSIASADAWEVRDAVTREDGRYQTPPTLRPGTYLVSTAAPDIWAVARKEDISLAGIEVADVDLPLHRVSAVSGVVRDTATRQPLSGARVQLIGEDGMAAADVLSDTNGRYSLPAGAGTYLARAVKGGWAADTAHVTVTGTLDDVTAADFALAPACGSSMQSSRTAFPAEGGTGRITLNATCAACTFSSSSFLHLPRSCGTAGAVTFTVDPNPGAARTGWMVVPGGAVEIRQEGRRARSVGR
jgi:ELWxxDGT repeat protein